MAKKACINAAMHMLPTLIRTLQQGGYRVERRDDMPNGTFVQGGQQPIASYLFLEFPPLMYAGLRAAFYRMVPLPAPMLGPPMLGPPKPVKCMPEAIFSTPALRTFYAAGPETVAGIHFGDGSSFSGKWAIRWFIPGFSAQEYADTQTFLAQPFTAGGVGGLGPFTARLVRHSGYEYIHIDAHAVREAQSAALVAAGGAALATIAPGSRLGEMGGYASAEVRDYVELLSYTTMPAWPPGITISGHTYAAEPAAPFFGDDVYPWRSRVPVPHTPGFAEVGTHDKPYCPRIPGQPAGQPGATNEAALVHAFCQGSSAQQFLDSLTWGGMPLPRQYGKDGLVQRCVGSLRSNRFHRYIDGGKQLPMMVDRHIVPGVRTDFALHQAYRLTAMKLYTERVHLESPANTPLPGIPFQYLSAPSTVMRLHEINIQWVPFCEAQRYWIDLHYSIANIMNGSAVVVRRMGRGEQ